MKIFQGMFLLFIEFVAHGVELQDQWVSFPEFLKRVTYFPKNVSFAERAQEIDQPLLFMFVRDLELCDQPLKPVKIYLGSGKLVDQQNFFSLKNSSWGMQVAT